MVCPSGKHLPAEILLLGKNPSTLCWKADMLPAHCPYAWTIVTAGAYKTYFPKETSHAAEALCVTNSSGDLTLASTGL